MEEKKSFYELIVEDVVGKWCDGLAILDLSDDAISIDNIFDNNEKGISINNYPISRKEKVLSKVTEMSYEEALREFNQNDKTIVSPKVSTDELITFEGFKRIEFGGNVYCHTQNNKIVVNGKEHFDDFNEVLYYKLISEKEMKGKWLVF
ncbi:hypothetical protein ACPWSR_16955 [Alloiococcus sp. CFN-8]|uniref:hypothetical protein n=1 Tax=Alloiococcus sp. CFN-8 TaxID=3416081 RepID=UPI003CF7F0BC